MHGIWYHHVHLMVKELINKLRKEMQKGLNKEYMLNEEDRILVYKFITKLKTEINSAEEN